MTDVDVPRDEPTADAWLLDAALDGELDAASSLAFERRLAHEPALRAQWDARRVLRQAVRAEATYHGAPPELRDRLRAALAQASAEPEPERGGPVRAVAAADSAASAGQASSSGLRWAGFGVEARTSEHTSEHTSAHTSAHTSEHAPIVTARRRAPRPWAWLASGVLAGAAAAVLVMAILPRPVGSSTGLVEATAARDSMAAEAVSAHTRALLVGETMEVASSDRHTVRPWLAARLNFVPPIVDFVGQGFPLAGARRDVIGGETAAALVYRHGAHVVSVFVRPAAAPAAARGSAAQLADSPPLLEVVRGFNVVEMRAGGMDYTLVSDMSGDEMRELARLLSGAAA
ncbi:MAG TPA: hypothetical protein VH328_15325 [Burkholderiaceae bacterium]|nr:hypothetical protein [Burkholderiaceae bacterium]